MELILTKEEKERWSEEKQKLMEECFSAIRWSCNEKIKAINEEYYSTEAWLEEEVSPRHPTITIFRSGIGNDMELNGKECVDFTVEL